MAFRVCGFQGVWGFERQGGLAASEADGKPSREDEDIAFFEEFFGADIDHFLVDLGARIADGVDVISALFAVDVGVFAGDGEIRVVGGEVEIGVGIGGGVGATEEDFIVEYGEVEGGSSLEVDDEAECAGGRHLLALCGLLCGEGGGGFGDGA